MNEVNVKNIIRFIVFLLIQVLILKRIQIAAPGFNLIHLFFYPLAILLLPLNSNRSFVLLISFLAGITVDFFYDSPGVHAFSAVLIGYLRTSFFKWLEPRGGYGTNVLPTLGLMGNTWVISYLALGMGVYILTYFSLQAFSLVFIFSILLKSTLSFIFSMILILVYIYVFNPRD